MSRKNFRERKISSSSEEEQDEVNVSETKSKETTNPTDSSDLKDKIEELKFLQKQRIRGHGIDVYSLAIGEQDATALTPSQLIDNDPWKTKTGGLVDLKKIKEKRGNEIVKNMNSNFARETNQRDEDAEMQKFIEEQLKAKKEQEKQKQENSNQNSLLNNDSEEDKNKFKRPEDALFDVPKYLIENTSKHKSEESLSEQMLSGIPEVDLGVEERIRNIEETERAKQRLFMSKQGHHSSNRYHQNKFKQGDNDSSEKKMNTSQKELHDEAQLYAPHNTSVNFVQHKRFDDALINPDHMIKPRFPRQNTNKTDYNQPVVGDAPKHELLQQHPHSGKRNVHTNPRHRPNTSSDEPPAPTTSNPTNNTNPSVSNKSNNNSNNSNNHKRAYTDRASDDYCLERFKKNMRFSRNSKIKIA